MRLTSFSYAALLLVAGMLLGLIVSKLGYEAYAVVVGALVIVVLVREWRVSSVEFEAVDDDG